MRTTPPTAATAGRRRSLPVALALLLAAGLSDPAVAADPPKPGSKAARAADFFATGGIPELRIEISDAELKKLRDQNRSYVRCTVTESATAADGAKRVATYTDVGVKLKGAAGSFRGVDDRPALTLNMDKFHDGQAFHGLDKFHLNNSVQDGTLLHELVSGHLFLKAGVPAARATHARVWLNKRDLGLYVLKEGFDPTFLRNHYPDATGNLYDGGFCREIDQPLEKDCGKGPDDHSDLKRLRAACAVGDPVKRQPELEKVLDIDKFLTFAALEMMTAHWDGYCRNRNNYRIYFNPTDGRAHFLPHGMDQMFGDPNFPLFDVGGMVGSAVLQIPAFRQRYRQKIEDLLPLFDPAKLHPVVDAATARIKPVLESFNKDWARGQQGGADDLKRRLTARHQGIQRILATTQEPLPVKFDANGELLVTGWGPVKETDDSTHAQQDLPGGRKALTIGVGPSKQAVASWRREVVLPAGKYELRGQASTTGVAPGPDSQSGPGGAGLRVSGGNRSNKLTGTADWTPLVHAFEVTQDGQKVILVAELRATAGSVRFDLASLKLVRLKP